jgi:hypothetical protein
MSDERMEDGSSDTLDLLETMSQPEARTRRKKAQTLHDCDWEPYKSTITLLYTTNTSVKEIQEYMETQHGFRAEYVIQAA